MHIVYWTVQLLLGVTAIQSGCEVGIMYYTKVNGKYLGVRNTLVFSFFVRRFCFVVQSVYQLLVDGSNDSLSQLISYLSTTTNKYTGAGQYSPDTGTWPENEDTWWTGQILGTVAGTFVIFYFLCVLTTTPQTVMLFPRPFLLHFIILTFPLFTSPPFSNHTIYAGFLIFALFSEGIMNICAKISNPMAQTDIAFSEKVYCKYCCVRCAAVVYCLLY